MEKVINEFRLIETDDGYRIEIKGDKERLKKLLFGGFGGFGGRKHWKKRHRRGPFGFGFGPMAWMHGDFFGDHEREHGHEEADKSKDKSED